MNTGNKYWLKLSSDFFGGKTARIIESMDNGKDYLLLYVKMMVESTPTEGKLRVTDSIPYTDRTLAAAMNTNVDVMRSALRVLREFGLVEVLDDQTLYFPEAAANVGKESVGAERVRRCRERKALQCNSEETICNADVTSGNAAAKKAANVDKSNVRDDCPYDDIVKLWNTVCKSFTPIGGIKGCRKEKVKARWDEHKSLEIFELLFRTIESSSFLKTVPAQKWAKFDWFMLPDHFTKTLEGNYGNINDINSSFDVDNVMENILSQYV